MAGKTANVTARIQPDIKEQAEAILERLGIPVSVFIDMTYRQVIMRDGVPFSLDIPDKLIHLHFLHRRAAVKSSSLPAYRLPLQQIGWYLSAKKQPQTGQVTMGQGNNAVQGQPLRAAAPARTGES